MIWQTLRRLVAYILDIVLLFGVLGVGLQTLTSTVFGIPNFERLSHSPLELEGWVLLTMSLPSWIYFIASDLLGGATLGKRLFGLHTTNLAGQRITFAQALGRTALK